MSSLIDIIEGNFNLAKKKLGSNDDAIESLYKIRISICNDCEHASNTKIRRCKLCGCLLESKTRAKGSECPIKKW